VSVLGSSALVCAACSSLCVAMLRPLNSSGWCYGCYLPHDNGMTGQIYYAVSLLSVLGVQLWIDVSACSEIGPQGKAVTRRGLQRSSCSVIKPGRAGTVLIRRIRGDEREDQSVCRSES
jgi:hypothetical protein